ncbi:MAG: 2Fe-2S iron-sulfur cluster binding domain-containing protein, partial [Acidobacteriota bacterium]|nr:2Fe-2S iron-sulfur cluster binding domain-containing protein [Acidobacteriota bacterium]
MYVIEFEPVGRRGECPENETLLECARRLDVDIVNVCGGAGVCGRCKIQIVTGEVSPLTAKEKTVLTEKEIAAGYRLACLA